MEIGDHNRNLMDKFIPETQIEMERTLGYAKIIEKYFPDDLEFTASMDEEEMAGYLYDALLEIGENPDEVLHEYGVIEDDA